MAQALSDEELNRYDRQILIDEIGTAGQQKLKKGKVFISGAGGLGSPVALYLAVAGIGTITIIDHDSVNLSNLNRQILHGDADIGAQKVVSAKKKLESINSNISVNIQNVTVTEKNVANLVAGHDVIIDALDNLETRYLLNKAALDQNIPFIHGAVNGFEGRVLTVMPGESTCLRCLYRGPIAAVEKFPVIGVAPAVIGAIQATEAIKIILNIGELLANRLMLYDGLNLKWSEFKVSKNPKCDHCGHLKEREGT
jgi:molybdopterin-synthase adenylyltransferase